MGLKIDVITVNHGQLIEMTSNRICGDVFIYSDNNGMYIVVRPNANMVATRLSKMFDKITRIFGDVKYDKLNNYKTEYFDINKIFFHNGRL